MMIAFPMPFFIFAKPYFDSAFQGFYPVYLNPVSSYHLPSDTPKALFLWLNICIYSHLLSTHIYLPLS
uniref:Uncharacterized protein n=1 Tax=Lepeophtheirus salmonis TaxID=72036 RepID=A0A0K2UP14_LEPSM